MLPAKYRFSSLKSWSSRGPAQNVRREIRAATGPGTASYFSIGTFTMLPHSVQLPS